MADGIAVGMATTIFPHNARDIYDALIYTIDQTTQGLEVDVEDLINIVKAPDFPTGGTIIGLESIKNAYRTGRSGKKGGFIVRSKYEIEETDKKRAIIVTEIPYGVNKANLVQSIADLMKEKRVEGISEVRDESDRDGMRIVIELKRDANSQLVINKLLKHTKLQDSLSFNIVALVNGEPKTLSLKDCIEYFLAHAADVILRRSRYELDKDRTRLNIVEGILKCLSSEEATNWVINTIRTADDPEKMLVEEGGLNETQAKYIIDMKLRQLTKDAEQKLNKEKTDLGVDIDKLQAIIDDDNQLLATMKSEFEDLKAKYGDDRKTEISIDSAEIDEEDLVKDETLVISITNDGLIKSVVETEYKAQGRGGKGLKMTNNTEDAIKYLMTVNSRDDLLFFTNMGRCHTLKAYKIPTTARTNKGRSLNNYLNLNGDEFVINVLTADLKDRTNSLLFVTRNGIIKRLSMEQLSTRLSITKIMSFKEGDALVSALIVKSKDNVIITTAMGQSIRIAMNATGGKAIRPMGREAAGVIGIDVSNEDYVVDMVVVEEGHSLITVTEKGLGKRTALDEFGVQGRGGVGLIAHKVNDKTGRVVAATTVLESDELFVATRNGLIIRIEAGTVNQFGRNTAGVKVINLNEGDEVASISKTAADTAETA